MMDDIPDDIISDARRLRIKLTMFQKKHGHLDLQEIASALYDERKRAIDLGSAGGAPFLVRAMASHDALVAALEESNEAMLLSDGEVGGEFHERIQANKAALALARKGGG